MEPEGKLPITITFEIMQHLEPNDHWYTVTAVLSWEEAGFEQRMDPALCLQDELSKTKEAICFIVGEHFNIQDVKEQAMPHLIKDIPIGKKAWVSALAAFLDDGSLCVLLDADLPCVPAYAYPYMLHVWHLADGFYVAERTRDEAPACFVKAEIVEKRLWNSYLDDQRREARKAWYQRL
jgi:hypothetical protein